MEDHKIEKERTENIVPESSSKENEQENKLANSPAGSEQSDDFKQHRPLFDAVRRGEWDTAKAYLDQHPDAVRARSNADSEQSDDFKQHRPLFVAVRRGEWDTAKAYLDQHPDAVRASSNASKNTPLHIAVSAGHLHIVEELVQLLTEENLLIQGMDGFTVLALSIRTGNIPIARCLIGKNRELLTVDHETESIPVVHAVIVSQFEMARYLYSVTPREALTSPDNVRIGSNLIVKCIFRTVFDIPLDLLEHCPGLAITANQKYQSPVWSFACRPKSFLRSGCRLGFWQQWVYDRIDIARCSANQVTIDLRQNQEFTQIDKTDLTAIRSALVGVLARMPSILLQLFDVKDMYERKLLHVQSSELLSRMCREIESSSDEFLAIKGRVLGAIGEAVYQENVELMMKVTRANPELVWTNDIAFKVFMLAIELRHAKIFNLIYGLPDKQAIASLRDKDGNHMLHQAASIPSSKTLALIPGAALQMQRELQWFEEVEALVTPAYNDFANWASKRPRLIFTENHKDLVIAGEKWMKETSSSCTVVGALIVTITFAVAFTVPGGNNQETGFPIFRNKNLSKLFIISDAMSLFSSATSVLMFLGILTSRYAEEDFLKSLPKKMIIGLSTLFFSIATMMIAFCVALSLMLQDKWIVLIVSLLASIPVTLFVWIQFPLLAVIYRNTYGPSIFNRNVKPWLYG